MVMVEGDSPKPGVEMRFAEYDRQKVLRCPHCGTRLGYALVTAVSGPYSRFLAVFDRGVSTRPPNAPTTIADTVASCAGCRGICYVVEEQTVLTRRYDARWIAKTLADNKMILGLPAH